MLKGAILGVGHVAVHGHMPAWRERTDVAIVAGADARPERRGAFLEAFPEGRWYATAGDLLEKEELDFVDICTPPSSHTELCRIALSCSVHVLCEKPLVLSPEELRGLPALAAENARVLFTVHNWKHAPILAKVTELVRAGTLGEVRRVRWETLRNQPAVAVGEQGNWRVDPSQSGGGILVDHGWHALYAISQWILEPPRTVAARLSIRKHHEWPIEDTVDLVLAYSSAAAEVRLSWAAAERANRVEVEGTDARLALDGGTLTLFERDATEPISEWTFPSLAEGSHHADWFAGVITEFVAEIENPRERGRNLAEAALCAHVIALAKESSRRGGAPLASERIGPAGTRP